MPIFFVIFTPILGFLRIKSSWSHIFTSTLELSGYEHRRDEEDQPVEQPTAKGIGTDNKGSKLLQKMGWQAGTASKPQQPLLRPLPLRIPREAYHMKYHMISATVDTLRSIPSVQGAEQPIVF